MASKAPKKPSPKAPPSESQGARLARDVSVWQQLDELLKKHEHTFQHVLELFPAYVRRLHLGRFLAHYELFKQVIDLPGCIVELGVYRGPSFFTWAKLLEIFCPGDRKRLVFGFESFADPRNIHEKDSEKAVAHGKRPEGYSAEALREEVEALTRICNLDNFISGNERCKLIIGDLVDTLPVFLKENPGLRIALLHLDVDLYVPTKTAMELLYPLVVKGGVVIVDKYGLIPFDGESKALEEYFAEQGIEIPVMKKFPFNTQPHGYFIK